MGVGGPWAVLTAVLCSLQAVEERCIYRVNPENSNWTEVKREAWVSSSLFGVSRAVQVSVAWSPCCAISFKSSVAAVRVPCAGFPPFPMAFQPL